MGGLGPPRRTTAAPTRARAAAGIIAALALVLLGGCGGDDPPGSGDGPGSSATSGSAAPSASPTPSLLEDGERVDGPVFSFIRPADYTPAKNNSDGGSGSSGGWSRIYSDKANFGFNSVAVDYQKVAADIRAKSIPFYLRTRAAQQIRRVEDVRVMGKRAGHWTARNEELLFNTYLVDLDDAFTLQINFERSRRLPEQEALQEAVLNSFRLTK